NSISPLCGSQREFCPVVGSHNGGRQWRTAESVLACRVALRPDEARVARPKTLLTRQGLCQDIKGRALDWFMYHKKVMKLDQFPGVNAGYVLELYERYRQDPGSVDAATRVAFDEWIPPDPVASGAPSAPAASANILVAVGASQL